MTTSSLSTPSRRPLSRANGVSLYVQVRDRLRADIIKLPPESMIPVEAELGALFEVSRITVRKAVDDLVSEGILVRRQGKGTFTQSRKLTHELNTVTSWTEQLKMLGFIPHTSNRSLLEVEASEEIAEPLDLRPGDPVYQLSRVRLVDHEPISLMRNYLPAYLVPNLEKQISRYESLYELLEAKYGLIPSLAVDTVETRFATNEEAESLKVSRKTPVLCVNRISYLTNETPLEKVTVVSRGDRYQYKVSLKGRARLR